MNIILKMWPPPKVVTSEHVFSAWKDQVEITKAIGMIPDLESAQKVRKIYGEGFAFPEWVLDKKLWLKYA